MVAGEGYNHKEEGIGNRRSLLCKSLHITTASSQFEMSKVRQHVEHSPQTTVIIYHFKNLCGTS